jgi:hypothetical protein
MVGGSYSLIGGFWSLNVVQLPRGPQLSIMATGGNSALISWPSPATGFILQECTNPAGGSWTAASETVVDNGTIRYIIVSPATGNRFYRLVGP